MSNQLPTNEELSTLPLCAIVAYAARCARRVQPLYDVPKDHPKRDIFVHDIDAAIKYAESRAQRTIDARDVRFASAAYAAAYAAARAAYVAYAAADAADAAYAAYAADAAYAAAEAADAAAAVAVAVAVAVADADAESSYLAAASIDFVNLRRMFPQITEGASIDASESGPLGPLWPEGPPEWYVERRRQLDADLARISANGSPQAIDQVATTIDPERLILSVTVGEFTPLDEAADEVVKLYEALNAAHIYGGGSGLVVDDWQMFVEPAVPVAGGVR